MKPLFTGARRLYIEGGRVAAINHAVHFAPRPAFGSDRRLTACLDGDGTGKENNVPVIPPPDQLAGTSVDVGALREPCYAAGRQLGR